MDRTEALVALNLSMDIGSIRLSRLIDAFGTPENIFTASFEQLSLVPGIGNHIAAAVSGFKQECLDLEMELVRKHGLSVLTIYDPEYPKSLQYSFDKPIVLYVKGGIEERDCLGLAIVGCRMPSLYGMEQASLFASELAQRGVTIISGMARGIDTASHQGALKAGGRTIAVIGSGLGDIYPPENDPLAQKICERGAVVSEFPVSTKPNRYNFPRRNRIISGMAIGVLVVEAGRNSGSLITANFALEQGREVFVLPGRVDTPQAFGTNSLIKDGAALVTCVQDILDELPFLDAGLRKSCGDSEASAPPAASLSCLESALYNIISCHPVTMEVLVEKTRLDISDLSEILLKLTLKKLITQVSAGIYIRSSNAR